MRSHNGSPRIMGVGVVGAGSPNIATQQHLPAIACIPELALRAIFDPNVDGARQYAQECGAGSCASFEELIAREDIEQVHICSPDPFHAEQTIAALEAGKHVLVQKPMATTMEDARAMVETARRKGKRLTICHNVRWTPIYSAAKSAVSTGRIGEPVYVRFRKWGRHFSYPKNSWYRQDPDGQFVHNGPHYVDLACWLMDDLPVSVFARSMRRYPTDDALNSDNYVSAFYRFARGGQGNVELNQLMLDPPIYPDQSESVVIGTEGRIEIGGPTQSSLQCFVAGQVCYPLAAPGGNDAFVELIRDFTEAIIEDREPAVTPEHALAVTAACLGALESSHSGEVVCLGGGTGSD